MRRLDLVCEERSPARKQRGVYQDAIEDSRIHIGFDGARYSLSSHAGWMRKGLRVMQEETRRTASAILRILSLDFLLQPGPPIFVDTP